MLSLNCQSISAKFDKLKLYLDDANSQNLISIICIQETWGHEGIDMNYFLLSNYRLIHANRRLTIHVGLIMCIHNDFEFKELNEENTHYTYTKFIPKFVCQSLGGGG